MRLLAATAALVIAAPVWAADEAPVSQDMLDLIIQVGEANDCLITRDLAKAELLPAGFTGRTFEKSLRYLQKQGKGQIDSGTFKLATETCG
ncbi:hypothetical protein BXY66_1920 [Shimia isoporae]|uniref:Uncharacterized protein n=1 Tax=Shimia isoporae TaxID=647720 RepID=A0A4R1NNS4_9RHOB|nr:hypothetical protein [Shimia isoporae]TCL09855.1 hypothetical protein BXY66_1920 [Shimia isoporae]